MKLHGKVTRRAPRHGFVSDVDTNLKASQEGHEYEYQQISPGFFIVIHGEAAYVIEEGKKHIGCSCPDMTHRKTHQDGCKHLIAFNRRTKDATGTLTDEMADLLRKQGWTGDIVLIPPKETETKAKTKAEAKAKTKAEAKAKKVPIHDPARTPGPGGEKRKDDKHRWDGMTPAQMCEAMSDTELRKNARKGGVAAIAEVARRETEASK